jgi:curved DNA-binding protein
MAVDFKDYYKILGVSRTATEEEIRKTFRKLARQHHPDVAKNKATAEEKFKEINEAYEVLSDPEKRRKYDTLGANWNRPGGFSPPPEWEQARGYRGGKPGAQGEDFEFRFGGTGFSDFFEQFFGARGSRFEGSGPFEGSRPRPGEEFFTGGARSQKGTDIEGDILVSLDEVLHGSVRPVTLQRTNPRTGQSETSTFRVKIPEGVQDGQLIRLAGKGEEGVGGGSPGDLYLRVRLAKHPEFRVHGADLICDLQLAPWEAVLGGEASIPTLEGPISLRIRPGTTGGQQLRVRGKGLPVGKGSRGDLYATISIEVPTEFSAEEKALWEQLARVSNFNPRKPA